MYFAIWGEAWDKAGMYGVSPPVSEQLGVPHTKSLFALANLLNMENAPACNIKPLYNILQLGPFSYFINTLYSGNNETPV